MAEKKEETMQSKKLAGSRPTVSTQRYLDIAEIREDVVVLRDGTLRSVLLVSSINFALKSEEEQEAIISAYVGFMNALTHPIQIVVQSRRLNVEDYLNRLSEAQKNQTNELLRAQIADYRQFVSELVSLADIMKKNFYVIVPYDPLTNKQKSFWTRLQESVSPVLSVRLKEKRFEQRRKDLLQRTEHIISNLGSIGLTSVRLNTQALIELFYSSYNPDIAESEPMVEIDKIRVEE